MHFHPWRRLRDLTHIDVRWCHLPDGILAETDGDTIWMDRRQSQRQKRSTLAHELAHITRGIPCSADEREEQRVEQIAAQHLIPLVALAEAIAWSMDENDLADDLWVDPAMVRARLDGLSDAEKAYIEDRVRAIEETA